MKYVYFVSYVHKTEDKWGYGNVDVTISAKIKSIQIVRQIEDQLKQDMTCEKLIVQNYQLISTKWFWNL